jgi:hypothetical protein
VQAAPVNCAQAVTEPIFPMSASRRLDPFHQIAKQISVQGGDCYLSRAVDKFGKPSIPFSAWIAAHPPRVPSFFAGLWRHTARERGLAISHGPKLPVSQARPG